MERLSFIMINKMKYVDDNKTKSVVYFDEQVFS